MSLTHVFAPITKSEKLADGSLLVYGKITGPDLDLDQQICDPEWLKSAVPDWFKIGNIREMHQAWAVGKALDLEADGEDWYSTVKVVDADAIKKVDTGVYTGFSIGIKGPKIVKDAAAPNGRITGGKIIETSLVDAPCNESAKILLAKVSKAGDWLASNVIVKDAADPMDMAGSAADEGTVADETIDTGEEAQEVNLLGVARAALVALLAGEVAEMAEGEGGLGPIQILTYVISELEWFAECDAMDDVAARIESMKVARTPEDLMNLTMLATLTKAATADDASDDDKTAVAELTKALGVDDLREQIAAQATQIDTLQTEAKATAEEHKTLADGLAKVSNTVIEIGPARTRTAPTATENPQLLKAAEYRRTAAQLNDREAAAAYIRLADRLEAAVGA